MNIAEAITDAAAHHVESLGIEAWEAEEGIEGIIWDDGREGPAFTAESYGAIEAAVVQAGFEYREVEDNIVSRTLVADWRLQSADGIETAILEVSR